MLKSANAIRGLLLATVVAVILVGGCQTSESENLAEVSGTTKSLPKLRFHKPKNLSSALKRLRVLHDVLVSDAPMPSPTTFKVVEIVHGTGAAAHSHYHLAGQDNEHDHEPTEDEILHDYEVGAVTELADIVKWLPKIAADSDLDEDSWSKVSDGAKKLGAIVQPKLDSLNDEDEKRSAYQAIGTETEKCLLELEEIASKVSADTSEPNG